MNFCEISASYADPDGSIATGSLTLTPEADITDGLVTIVARPINVPVVAGSASAMVETDGSSLYRIDERLTGASVVSWVAAIPSGTVDLATLRDQYCGVAFG